MQPLLRIRNLSKTFTLHQLNSKKIVGCTSIDLTLNPGHFIGITGKSGAGKSTILKCIYRTYIPSEGTMRFNSSQYGMIDLAQASEQQIVDIRRKEIGYVSQFLKVLPRVSALRVVQEALIEMGNTEEEAEKSARVMLAFFQLPEKLWDAYPNTFSGGEKLRLNLARAMIKQPKLLLLDEPTASLDNQSKEFVKDMMIKLKKSGTSMVGIFHDLDFMEQVVDLEYAMSEGQLNGGLAV